MPRYQKLVNESNTNSSSSSGNCCPPQKQKQKQQQQQQQQSQSQQPSHLHYQQLPQLPNVGYHLYLYREQLSRRNVEYMRLSKAKYFITETLLAKTVRNLKGCSLDELKTVNNQIVFKHKLRHQIQRLRKLQSLGIRNANPKMESTEL